LSASFDLTLPLFVVLQTACTNKCSYHLSSSSLTVKISSVLDGMVAQSKRLEGASNSGGGANTDDEIIYMLSILDGLNSQVRRLDREKTFAILDEVNAKASMALL